MSTPPPVAGSFEHSLARLETIVNELERADLALEASIQLFEEGMALVGDCRKQLDEAEGKVEMLVKRAGGALAAEPFTLREGETS
jgi:exodeoxyribonuclease VII small subunit